MTALGGERLSKITKLERVLRPAKALLLTALVIYVAYLLAQLSWHVVSQPIAKPVVLSEISIASSAGLTERASAVPRLHLFGKVGVTALAKSDQPKTAPKTRLRLVLKGVFTEDLGSASGAIIEEIGRSTEYYRIGDKVPGNATLEEVYSDRVLIRRAGKLETLAFDDVSSEGSSIAKVQAPKQNAQAYRSDVDTPEKFIEEAARRLSEDPSSALSSVGLAQGENGGYVYQGNNPMLSGMNLEKGDVIMSVNGHSLGDVQRDRELMRTLYEQGSVEVEVVRDGASFFVNYPLR
jgi:general secretion pathway protein C